jgi:hypothetical protein
MRLDDPVFIQFLRSAVQCLGANMSFFDDDTIIPETLYDADGNRFPNANERIFSDLDDLAEPRAPAAGGAVAARASGRGPQAPACAADMAAAIFARSGKEPLPSSLQTFYPYVFRAYTDDYDAFAMIEWTKCSAVNIWSILTSQHLVVGATKSMSFMLTFAIKTQLCTSLKHFFDTATQEALKKHLQDKGDRGIKVTPELEKLFLDCCAQPGVLATLATALASYNITQHHVIRFRPGVFFLKCLRFSTGLPASRRAWSSLLFRTNFIPWPMQIRLGSPCMSQHCASIATSSASSSASRRIM